MQTTSLYTLLVIFVVVFGDESFISQLELMEWTSNLEFVIADKISVEDNCLFPVSGAIVIAITSPFSSRWTMTLEPLFSSMLLSPTWHQASFAALRQKAIKNRVSLKDSSFDSSMVFRDVMLNTTPFSLDVNNMRVKDDSPARDGIVLTIPL